MTELQKKVISNRISKLDSKYDLEDYLNPSEEKLIPNLYKLKDIQEAAKLIKKHIDSNSLIILAVDIDTDGISSGVIGYKTFLDIFKINKDNLKLVISSRKYTRGFNNDMITKLENIKLKTNRNVDLIITADMGSYDNENYKKLKEFYNFDLIVTDHHEVPDNNYPTEANYFINPQRKDNSEGKGICGCCVLFLLLYEVAKLLFKDPFKELKPILPYVSVATIVDMMPMDDIINRFIIKNGLDYINNNLDRNFNNYKRILKLNQIGYTECGLNIGPFINTANRTNTEELCLLSLITEDDERSFKILNYIQSLNKLRKSKTNELLDNVISNYDGKYLDSYVQMIDCDLYISGSIANAIANTYNRPSIIFLNNKSDVISGSGRNGLDGFDMLTILKELKEEYPDVVIEAAGHKSACGVNIYKNKLEEFRNLYNSKVKDKLKDFKLPTYEAEFTLEHKDITLELALDIVNVGPYGINWNKPIFTSSETFTVIELVPINNFYKFLFKLKDGRYIQALHFFSISTKINKSNLREIIRKGMEVKLLFNIGINNFTKELEPQLEIIDIESIL